MNKVFIGGIGAVKSKKNLSIVKIPISKNPTNLVYLKSVDLYFNNISGNLYKRLKGNVVDFDNPFKAKNMNDNFYKKLSDYDFGTLKNYFDSKFSK